MQKFARLAVNVLIFIKRFYAIFNANHYKIYTNFRADEI